MDEKNIINTLNISEDERKYIEICKNGVSLRLSLKHSIRLDADIKNCYLSSEIKRDFESDPQTRFAKIMTEFWDEEAGREGVTLKARLNDFSEAEFFKETRTEEEVRSAVLSMIKLKRRLGL